MTLLKISVILFLAVAAVAQEYQHHQTTPVHHMEEHHAHPKYEFKYGVKDEYTHDIKEQAEKRDGDKVEGYYKLVEPDGTTRIVHYTADKHTGFHAHVERSGHATHPIHHHHEASHHVEVPRQAQASKHHYTASSYSNTNHH